MFVPTKSPSSGFVRRVRRVNNGLNMAFHETLLYGRHGNELRDFAQRQAWSTRQREERLKRQIEDEESCFTRRCAKLVARWKRVSETHAGRTIEDLVFLSSLGITVAVFSFFIDMVINRCHAGQLYLLQLLSPSVPAQFFGWVGSFVVLTCFSVGITHIIAPTAIGSGIPEIKTMIRGVVMKEYLTFRTMFAKVVGLMAALGSRLPIGKEGPFVHIASALASVITRRLPSFSSGFQNYEKRMADILAPACAVGVSCTFGAPFGEAFIRTIFCLLLLLPVLSTVISWCTAVERLLFSIEATATYFAVRNYWRAFYASVIGTIMFRALAVFIHEEETLTALHKTHLPQEIPFDDLEMIGFAILGLVCGLGGVLFITIHKYVVNTLRQQLKINHFLQKKFIYPTIVAFLVGASLFPFGLGQYYVSETWSMSEPEDIDEQLVAKRWFGPKNNVFLTLFLFCAMRLWMSAISTTCPFLCGVFLPALTIGAGLGRLFGEAMARTFPNGVGGHFIVPGGYALVGATAYAGAVTHTLSPVIIMIELTGQIGHLVPTLVAIMIANMCSRWLTLSIYDLIITTKKLPYLPPRIDTSTEVLSHSVLAEDIMARELKYLTTTSTYKQAHDLLTSFHFKTFPIVTSSDEMLLMGSIERRDLHRAVDDQLSLENKLQYFNRKLQAYYELPALARSGTVSSRRTCRFPSSQNLLVEDDTSTVQTSTVNDRPTANSCQQRTSTVKPPAAIDSTEILAEFQTDRSCIIAEEAVNAACAPTVNVRAKCKPSLLLDIHDPQQELEWENYELSQTIDFSRCRVNIAPFQIVDKMSLYQLHSLFSLLRLHHTLVTSAGRLVGIISLNEVRKAIQGEIDIGLPVQSSIRQRLSDWCSCRPSERGIDEDDDNGNMENIQFDSLTSRKLS